MYLWLSIEEDGKNHVRKHNFGASPPLFLGFSPGKCHAAQIASCDLGSIILTCYLCIARAEALLMASSTSYHKRLQGSIGVFHHVYALFAAC